MKIVPESIRHPAGVEINSVPLRCNDFRQVKKKRHKSNLVKMMEDLDPRNKRVHLGMYIDELCGGWGEKKRSKCVEAAEDEKRSS